MTEKGPLEAESNRRKVEVVQVKPTETAKSGPSAKHLGNEALAKAAGTSGPSNRGPAEAIQVKRTDEAKRSPKTKYRGAEAPSAVPGTSGPSYRRPTTAQVSQDD